VNSIFGKLRSLGFSGAAMVVPLGVVEPG